jgi:hypothetical protein
MQVYRDYENVFGSANRVAIALVRRTGTSTTRSSWTS